MYRICGRFLYFLLYFVDYAFNWPSMLEDEVHITAYVVLKIDLTRIVLSVDCATAAGVAAKAFEVRRVRGSAMWCLLLMFSG